jgi:hypothetical protein
MQKIVLSKQQSTMGQKPRPLQETQLLQSTNTQSAQSGQLSYPHLTIGDADASYLEQKETYQL